MSMVGAAKLLVLTYHHIFHHGLMQIVLDMCCCYKTLILQKTFGSNKMQVEGSSVRALCVRKNKCCGPSCFSRRSRAA